MARPRKQTDEHHGERLTVRFSRAGMNKVRDIAQRAGLRRAEAVRRMIEDGKIAIRQTKDTDPRLIAEWNSIGVNLNQIARKANATGRFDPAEIEAVLARLDRLITAHLGEHDGPDHRQ
jgi:hypothetical protein